MLAPPPSGRQALAGAALGLCLTAPASSAFAREDPLADGPELPPGFVDELVVGGLGQITDFVAAADGRLYIAEKAGTVRVAIDDALLPEPFVDLSPIVNDRVDRGLLSIELHPQFPDLPYVYLYYTYEPPELLAEALAGAAGEDGNGSRVARLVRVEADAARDHRVAVAGSETVLLGKNSTYENIGDPETVSDASEPSCGPIGAPVRDCLPIDEDSHTVGSVRFGPDGSLYVTNGDGASYREAVELAIEAQNLDSLRGKLLRIDPETGLGLSDNPFFDGDLASNRSRVLAYGLRNPFTLVVDSRDGVPYVGDVGWQVWEEINGGVGLNFGWPCYVGAGLRDPDYVAFARCQALYGSGTAIALPLATWEQMDGIGAAIVGDFERGGVFPERYAGALFYADFLLGWLRYLWVDDLERGSRPFADGMPPASRYRFGADGALRYASINTGEIRRIRYAGVSDTAEPGLGPEPSPEPVPESSLEPESDAPAPLPTLVPSDPVGEPIDDASADGEVSVGGGAPSAPLLLPPLALLLWRGRAVAISRTSRASGSIRCGGAQGRDDRGRQPSRMPGRGAPLPAIPRRRHSPRPDDRALPREPSR